MESQLYLGIQKLNPAAYADHGEGLTVDANFAADRGVLPGEPLLPGPYVQYRFLRLAISPSSSVKKRPGAAGPAAAERDASGMQERAVRSRRRRVSRVCCKAPALEHSSL